MKISVRIVTPGRKGDYTQELEDCITQIVSEGTGRRAVSATLFLSTTDNRIFEQYKKIATDALNGRLEDLCGVNFVCQPPANGDQVAMEIHLIEDEDYMLVPLDHQGIRYIRAEKEGMNKGIFVAGIHSGYQAGVPEAYDKVFTCMEEILTREGLTFHHIVRQWNYIEDILEEVTLDGIRRQHYQVFNDVRSDFYGRHTFLNGYPAATGIGNMAGGVSISFYALPDSSDIRIFQVDNPFQKPAYAYPDQVLMGEADRDSRGKTTPKFVRAKHIKNETGHMTFISGTASIRQENTVAAGNMQEQLRITIENMLELITKENLLRSGIENHNRETIVYFRVYVKETDSIDDVTRRCEELLPGVPYILLVSDICRNDLLIEIEGFSY